MEIDEVVDELYRLELAEFTPRRDALSTEARKAGDRDLAATVKALRKPSAAAYTVNLMSRVRPDEIDRLIELGGRMREAQAQLSGDDLRALGRQRSQLVAGLATEARRIARDHGHAVSDAVHKEVQATFEAALADAWAGEAVRGGCLIRSLYRTGMDPVDLTGAVAGQAPPGPARRTPPAKAAESGPGRSGTDRPGAARSGTDRSGAARSGAGANAGSASARQGGTGSADADAEDRAAREAEEADRRRAEEERARRVQEERDRLAEEVARLEAEEETAATELESARAALEQASQDRAAADDDVAQLESRLVDARRRAEDATGAERAARRAQSDAEDRSERAAAATRRARDRLDAGP
ncbi:MAG TPA: hypothetical protein VG435_21255 [Acidimicrobiales bacterium]|jgi:hypothetical protein|nr:hypothetical protein [Acidimicrobiales bacterium]